MNAEIQVDEKLIEAFHLMFDHYPEPAQLTHKSKRIIALNAACKAIGRDVGMICAAHGNPEAHKGCLASRAIQEHKTQWKMMENPVQGKQNPVIFWLPVDGYPDYYIHFGVGSSLDYSAGQESS